VLALAIGGAFYGAAIVERDAAKGAATYAELDDRAGGVRLREWIAWTGLATGSALLLSTIIYYVTR
jgi:hypothetical protein